MRRDRAVLLLVFVIFTLAVASVTASNLGDLFLYLPYVSKALPTPTPTPTATPAPPPSGVEFRGLWVTRFNWTNGIDPASPAALDEIVDNAALAGFNAILFQVRGTADAYYTPGLEPWAQRVSGNVLGEPPNPYWDPLAHMVQRAHERGIQVHAYFNVYPLWHCGDPPRHTTPEHLYHRLANHHGTTNGKLNGVMWTTSDDMLCSDYLRATPASIFVDDHMLAVVRDLVGRYDIDGLHLDHIRYGGSNTSCDPVSESRAGGDCFDVAPAGYATYGDWQRAQVNGTVARFYDTLFGDDGVADKPNFMLSGAVWPFYDSGYNNYYQDSKAWLAGGYIDALMPMLYGSTMDSGDNPLERWRSEAASYQSANAGRFVITGVHGNYQNFSDIANRIQAARELGAVGQAIFAYNYLAANRYFDDLAEGPYAEPASPPTITWHP